MKCKKFLALVMTAVLSVSMLAGCGGGGGGVSGSLDMNEVNTLLDSTGRDIQVEKLNRLDNAVRDAAERIASTGSTNGAEQIVSNAMEWSLTDFVGNAWNDFVNSGGVMGVDLAYGRTFIIEESRLETNTGAGILGAVNANSNLINKLKPINTPESFAAAQILIVDGSVGQLQDLTNDAVRFSYNASAKKAKTENGTYWVIAAQITAHVL